MWRPFVQYRRATVILLCMLVAFFPLSSCLVCSFSATRTQQRHLATVKRMLLPRAWEQDSTTTATTLSPSRQYSVRLAKPLGLVLEQDGVNKDVTVAHIVPDGHGAGTEICIRDVVCAVNGVSCQGQSLENVLDLIIHHSEPIVELVLEHAALSTQVYFVQEHGGSIGICAFAGEYLGNLAMEVGVDIPYSCRSGACGTCEQACHVGHVDSKRNKRYVRPCIYLIPSLPPTEDDINSSRLYVSPTDR